MPTQPELIHLDPSVLEASKNNPRTHSNKQIRQLADCIRLFGFLTAIVVDEHNAILAGHGRVEAAKMLGLETVPCIRAEHLTEAQKRAYRIADNRLTENSNWDADLLRIELGELAALDIDFDLELTGFETPEIDLIIGSVDQNRSADPAADEVPRTASIKRRCEVGDIWQLGSHKLYCGDARDRMGIRRLMSGQKADMTCIDPPYNVTVNGHVSSSGRHSEFAMASGEMSQQEFTLFLRESFATLAYFGKDGSLHYSFMDWRHQREILDAADGVFSDLINVIVWDKCAAGQGSFYRSGHELIYLFKQGSASHTNNIQLGRHGRNRSNVWRYKGLNTGGANRLEELARHPTAKPTQMLADAILDSTKRNGLILDTFAGSGSVLIAAEMTGRRARLAEIDPGYCNTILSRWESYAHGEAELLHRNATTTENKA